MSTVTVKLADQEIKIDVDDDDPSFQTINCELLRQTGHGLANGSIVVVPSNMKVILPIPVQ